MVVYPCKKSAPGPLRMRSRCAQGVRKVQLGCDWVSAFWLHLSSIIRIDTRNWYFRLLLIKPAGSAGWGRLEKQGKQGKLP